MTPNDLSLLLAVILLGTIGIYMLPSCDDTACQLAHQKHRVVSIARDIEWTHATFHDPLRPQPMCALCNREDES